MINKGKLFVISGPSGAGKSTVIARLLKRLDNTYFSISATTREPRRGERNDIDYHFVSREKFESMIANDELLEWAEYVGNYYGTPAAPVDEKLNAGYDVILDIETKGAAEVMKKRPEAIGIFLFPGSFEILEQRLRARGTDSEEKVLKRLDQARRECEKVDMYQYVIINDRVETAADEAVAIMTAEKCRTAERKHYFV
ncbi:MAG: guanylate kinase [Oscillospiraceae bacterium]|nr:guanylate kinase [Oscillospiraceae bacterium]